LRWSRSSAWSMNDRKGFEFGDAGS